jgi:hypothetical protein
VRFRGQLLQHDTLKKIWDSLFVGLQLALLFGLAKLGQLDFMRSVAATTCLWVGYIWLESKYNIYMNNYVRFVVILAIFADSFFGYYLGYYVTSVIFDKLLHIFGTYAFALFANILILQRINKPLPRIIECIVTVSFGISIGAIYEVAEFMVDSWGSPVLPSQPSLLDTDLDLIGDSIGALLAALHINYISLLDKQ